MPAYDPFQGAKVESDEQKRGLLEAIATGGAEGKKAYEAAQAQVGTYRQGALDRAQTRAQMTGQNLQGADTAPVTETADRFGTYFAGQQAANQGLLDSIGASGTSYLAKVGAIAPFMQQKNLDQAAAREAGFKSEIAANQSKIDAAKAAEQRAFQHDFDMLRERDKYDEKSSQRAAVAKAAKVDPLGKADILGAGQTLADGYSQYLNMPNAFSADEAGRALAAYKGVSPVEVNTLLGPRDVPKQSGPPVPPIFDKNWLTGAFKYDGKTISGARADEVLRAPEVQAAASFLPQITSLKRQGGVLDEDMFVNGEKVPVRGMSPRQVFEFWLDEQPGIRTMKTALRDYYGPYLDTLARA